MRRLGLSLLAPLMAMGAVIENGDFEEGSVGWTLWGAESYIDSTGGFGESGAALKVSAEKPEWYGAAQVVPVPDGARHFDIEGRIRTEDVIPGEKGWEQGQINIEYLDANKKLIDYPGAATLVMGTTGWKLHFERYTLPLDKEVAYVKVVLALGNSTGSIWFDKVALSFKDNSFNTVAEASSDAPLDWGQWYPLDTAGITEATTPVDWSGLLHTPAGKHGFVTRKGDGFAFEDGTDARFYGTVLVAGDAFTSNEKADSLVKRLSRSGCNLLRLHLIDVEWASENIFRGGGQTKKLNKDALERMDYLIHACKEAGIYTFLDFCAGREFYKADGLEEQAPSFGAKQNGFFSKPLIKLQKKFIKQLMNHRNKYTGVKYKNEPAIAMAELINETNVYSQFGENLITGTYEAELQARWEQAGKSDSVPLFTMDYDQTPPRIKLTRGDDYEAAVDFYRAIEADYFAQMLDYAVNRVGCKMPITGSNMPEQILSLVWATRDLPYAANDAYYDHPKLWELEENCSGDAWSKRYTARINNSSQLLDTVGATIPQLSYFVNSGQPYVAWGDQTFPNEYGLEANALLALYGSLQGWDGLVHHQTNLGKLGSEELDLFAWSYQPEDVALWTVLAPLFLRGDIAPAPTEVVEPVASSEFYENGNYSDFLKEHWQISYALRYGKAFTGDSVATKTVPAVLAKLVDRDKQQITSETGELVYDYGKGIVTVKSERLQGVLGHLKGEAFALPIMSGTVENPFAGLFAVSATEQPLVKADRFYLVAVTPSKMTGTKYDKARTALLSHGELPILCQVMDGQVRLNNGDYTISEVKFSGKKSVAQRVSGLFDLSKGRTMIYEVTRLR